MNILKGIGIDVKIGHSPEYVRGKDLVVYSSAVKDDNIELREARALGIPCIPRAEMLGELMRLKESIAVTGTHGKTTTTSIIATIFDKAGLDPTIIVGGKLKSLPTFSRIRRPSSIPGPAQASTEVRLSFEKELL